MSTTHLKKLLAVLAIAFGLCETSCRSQEHVSFRRYRSKATPSELMLRQMTQAAGVIFAGEVVAVKRPSGFAGAAQAAAEGVVTVEFRVGQPVRGCTGGSVYTMKEWAGLWAGGDRYHVGQRLLVFLHGADGEGLSSPVGGKAGLIPLRGGGRAPGPYDEDLGPSEWVADLKWVEAQASRVELPELHPAPLRDGPALPARMRSRARAGGESDAREMAASAEGHLSPSLASAPASFVRRLAQPRSTESATRPLSEVLNLCREWIGGFDGAL